MSKKNEKEEIYNLCKEFYDYENFLNYDHDKTKFNCFLIKKELIDKFKNNIFYDQLKDSIKRNIDFKHIDKNILNNSKKIKKNIVGTKFNNKQELLNELEKGKIFYVVTAQLFNNICKEDKKREKGIEALFHKGKVRLFYNDKKEKIDFKYNKDGTIGKSNIYNKETEKENQRKIIFKEDLEILIELYYYHKILKSKENACFKELNDENKETVYLISNNWIQNFKSFFEYKDLENELMNIDKENPLEIQYLFITDEFIDKKISSLTDSFIEKINNKNKPNLGKIKYEKMKLDKTDFDYLVNNQIVNSRIYIKLSKLYEGCDYSEVKKCDYCLVGNQKILLLFEKGVKKDIDEIGYINNENIFIPEFLLVYDNNDISTKILNQFFKNEFFNFSLNNENICDILDLNKSKIGKCHKLKNSENTGEGGGASNTAQTQNNSSDKKSEKDGIVLSINHFNEELGKIMRDPNKIKDDEGYLVKKFCLDNFNKNSGKISFIKDSLSDLSSLEYNIFYLKQFYIIDKNIYQKLCDNNFINKDENNIPTKYIINNGKLILEHEYTINIPFYNLLIVYFLHLKKKLFRLELIDKTVNYFYIFIRVNMQAKYK